MYFLFFFNTFNQEKANNRIEMFSAYFRLHNTDCIINNKEYIRTVHKTEYTRHNT